jgi:hypothetical protein
VALTKNDPRIVRPIVPVIVGATEHADSNDVLLLSLRPRANTMIIRDIIYDENGHQCFRICRRYLPGVMPTLRLKIRSIDSTCANPDKGAICSNVNAVVWSNS